MQKWRNQCMPHMLRNRDKMPDIDAETQFQPHAWTVDTKGAYVRCLTVGLHRSCCQCFSACTFIHGHSFSDSSLAKFTINEWIKYTGISNLITNISNLSLHCLMQCSVQNVAAVTPRWKFLWSFCSSQLFACGRVNMPNLPTHTAGRLYSHCELLHFTLQYLCNANYLAHSSCSNIV